MFIRILRFRFFALSFLILSLLFAFQNFSEVNWSISKPNIEKYIGQFGHNHFYSFATDLSKLKKAKTVIYVSSAAELKKAIIKLKPGSFVVIKNGVYDLGNIYWPATSSGVENNQVHLMAESLHGVKLVGSSQFRILGSYVVISGLHFFKTPLKSINIGGIGVRVHSNYFEGIGADQTTRGSALVVYTGAKYSEIDHNLFEGTRGISISFVKPLYNYKTQLIPKFGFVHHNTFLNITKPLSSVGVALNGGEAIMLGYGYSKLPEGYDDNLKAIVEFNKFDNAQGDDELISIKSSGNLIRNNYITNCNGSHINVRMGNSNQIIGNFIENASMGFRITGTNNLFAYNFVSIRSGGVALGFHHQDKWESPKDGRSELTHAYLGANRNMVLNNIFESSEFRVRIYKPVGILEFPMENNRIEYNILIGNKKESINDLSGYYSNIESFKASNTLANFNLSPGLDGAGYSFSKSERLEFQKFINTTYVKIKPPPWWNL